MDARHYQARPYDHARVRLASPGPLAPGPRQRYASPPPPRQQLLHRPADATLTASDVTHKKNSRGCWNGKKPSSRILGNAKKSYWQPNVSGKKPSSARSGAPNPASPPPNARRRTRRLILIGSYMEHITGDDPAKRDRLMKGLDVFLERDRDRELFDLAPNKENANGHPA